MVKGICKGQSSEYHCSSKVGHPRTRSCEPHKDQFHSALRREAASECIRARSAEPLPGTMQWRFPCQVWLRRQCYMSVEISVTVRPKNRRRWRQASVCEGVGSNPTAVTSSPGLQGLGRVCGSVSRRACYSRASAMHQVLPGTTLPLQAPPLAFLDARATWGLKPLTRRRPSNAKCEVCCAHLLSKRLTTPRKSLAESPCRAPERSRRAER